MTPDHLARAAAQQAEAQRQWVEHHADGTSTHYERHDVRVTLGDVLATKEIVTSVHIVGLTPAIHGAN